MRDHSIGILLRRFAAFVTVAALLMLCGTVSAQTAVDFDHLRTGFRLTGAHNQAACESCHVDGVFRGTPRNCQSCHAGGSRFSQGNSVLSVNHVPVLESCDSCHTTRTFSGARFRHLGVTPGGCGTCHNGMMASGKPASHIVTQAACDSCHRSNSSWAAARVDHGRFNASTVCSSCHNGASASGKSARHMPDSGLNCIACHTTARWSPTRWNHTQMPVTAQCANCHSGAYPPADGRGAGHIPYQSVPVAAAASCDSCHKGGYASWSPARFHGNFSVSNGCATCHSGAYAGVTAKPGTAVHAGVTSCEGCHRSTSSWGSATFAHSPANAIGTGTCDTCHNGATAVGKPGSHLPVTAGSPPCDTCHRSQVNFASAVVMNHALVPVTGRCASCHSGAYPPAEGRAPTHIPYQLVPGSAAASCEACHRSGYTSWMPAQFHPNFNVSTQCASCHTGTFPPAVGKPNTPVHIGVTTCESCHRSTANWASATFAHSPANAVGTGTCDSCHNGALAVGKPASHIPVSAGIAPCDTCHRSQVSFTTSVVMNHAAVGTSTCASCHGGAYASQGAQAKPANHVPESQLLNGAAMDCKSCHSSVTNWGSMTMNHNGSQGSGSGWCKACHASGTSYLGDMEKKSLTHRRSNPVPLDCSTSGCHRPLGNEGSTYRSW